MASLSERLAAKSERHSQLLEDIQSLSHAPSAVAQTSNYLTTLRAQLNETKTVLEEANAAVQKERLDHVKYGESHARKFMFTAVGQREKFEQKAAKEAREYYEALQKEHDMAARKDMLQRQITESEATLAEFQVAEAEHLELKKQLKDLYAELFTGPTLDVPQEDEMEQAETLAQRKFDEANGRLTNTTKALQCLETADKLMNGAKLDIRAAFHAKSAAHFDLGIASQIGGQTALSRAHTNSSQVEMLIQQARDLDPNIQPLPPMKISQGLMVVMNDDWSSSEALHHCAKLIEDALIALRSQIQVTRVHRRSLQFEANEAKGDLDLATEELSQIRKDAFRIIDPPPAYSG